MTGTTISVRAAMTALGASLVAAAMLNAAESPEATPEQVVRTYVHAVLADQDAATAARLTCRDPQVDVFTLWQQDLAARRARFGLAPLQADVTAYDGHVSGTRAHAMVQVAVTLVVNGRAQDRLTRPIDITLIRGRTWVVCAAQESLSR